MTTQTEFLASIGGLSIDIGAVVERTNQTLRLMGRTEGGPTGETLRDAGVAQATKTNAEWLDMARGVARGVEATKGSVCADDVRDLMAFPPATSAAWGALFLGKGWRLDKNLRDKNEHDADWINDIYSSKEIS